VKASGTPRGVGLKQVAEGCLDRALAMLRRSGHQIEESHVFVGQPGGKYTLPPGYVVISIEGESPYSAGLTSDIGRIIEDVIAGVLRRDGFEVEITLREAKHVAS
jgi:hypothetical protein